MDEREWLASDDPQAMLELAQDSASGRKLRLFACACCRRIWGHIADERVRRAVEVAERFAGLSAERDELLNAVVAAEDAAAEALVRRGLGAGSLAFTTAKAACHAADPAEEGGDPASAAERAAFVAYLADYIAAGGRLDRDYSKHLIAASGDNPERAAQCALLRDIIGNPFRPTRDDLFTRALDHRGVRQLARSIYDGNDFGSLPVLADALEEAACTDADILGHLRGPGPHVRGCWPVDLLRPDYH